MTRLKTTAAALAALVVTMGSANAACTLATVSNKTWIISVTDANPVNKYLIYCGFKTSAAGTFGLTPQGCTVSRGTDPTFATAPRADIAFGSFTQVGDKLCAFDFTLTFPSAASISSRIVMESGKSTGTGNWVSNFGSYGSATIARQQM